MTVLEREGGTAYKYYYKFPFPPDKKKPTLISRDMTIKEIFPPDQPYSSNMVWVWVSTDKIFQGMFQLGPGGFFNPPDAHAGDEVYYVLSGTLTVLCPETGSVNEVHEGEALLIPKDSYHQAFNFTDKKVLTLACIAPLMWDPKKGPAPHMKVKPKLFKVE